MIDLQRKEPKGDHSSEPWKGECRCMPPCALASSKLAGCQGLGWGERGCGRERKEIVLNEAFTFANIILPDNHFLWWAGPLCAVHQRHCIVLCHGKLEPTAWSKLALLQNWDHKLVYWWDWLVHVWANLQLTMMCLWWSWRLPRVGGDTSRFKATSQKIKSASRDEQRFTQKSFSNGTIFLRSNIIDHHKMGLICLQHVYI